MKITSTLFALLLALGWQNLSTRPADTSTNSRTSARAPLIIAHRGGAKEATENTIIAFNRAVGIGADGIETDLRLTKDGVVVIYHDERFGRVEGLKDTAQGRLISEMTYAELTSKPLPANGKDGGEARVPRLEDVLREVKGGLLNMELKRGDRFDELVEKTIALLKPFPALDRVVLEPPDLATAERLRAALGPQLKLHLNPGYDRSVPYDQALKRVLAFKPHSISVSYKKLSWEIVDEAHKAGVEVWVWTVDQPAIAEAMSLLGVDAIKTDLPTLMLNHFRSVRR